jgi:hypothetical protein
MIKPNSVFEYTRADEVAECWDGVPMELYGRLWENVVPYQREIPNIEDNGPADVVGWENLAAHWHRLTQEDQKTLNELAVKRELEYAEWRKGL